MVTNSKEKLLERVHSPDLMYTYCRILGCPNPASAGTPKGLNRLYCRKHEDHFEVHGSYTKKSYTAKEIDPYRRKAMRWLKENQDDPHVARAIKGIERLYRSSGSLVEAFRLRGLTPQERAKVAWARLREAKVDPMKPLAAWMAVEMIFLDDPQPELKQHFKWVQAAKIVHRLASGSHKRWEQEGYDGKVKVVELHKYPRSRGRVLLHMGKQLSAVGGQLMPNCLNQLGFGL